MKRVNSFLRCFSVVIIPFLSQKNIFFCSEINFVFLYWTLDFSAFQWAFVLAEHSFINKGVIIPIFNPWELFFGIV